MPRAARTGDRCSALGPSVEDERFASISRRRRVASSLGRTRLSNGKLFSTRGPRRGACQHRVLVDEGPVARDRGEQNCLRLRWCWKPHHALPRKIARWSLLAGRRLCRRWGPLPHESVFAARGSSTRQRPSRDAVSRGIFTRIIHVVVIRRWLLEWWCWGSVGGDKVPLSKRQEIGGRVPHSTTGDGVCFGSFMVTD